ncbi:DUF4333 domain-containing protein [Mycolicibacterium sp. 018/SC-01/001]|uniref:DUF4333 domain-containing protein n=1 Tax=Mycolicibacterium sp. 018/SC-01/001 TaxID=2592069 RepID=UPI00117FA445|nr:DUF4333 domain-containing protein [Mycolicibacterium sp. 018/SC-01/001]TRW79009.1 DUF4333 domain-containing protein [Mycolicibacterium sp. 018/SC-01/001]
MAKLIGAITVLAGAVGVLVGCGSPTGSDAIPAVAPQDLQSDIATRLAAAGEQPQSVVCKDPLVGEVGQSARCDVTLSATNSFEPIVTVTDIDGGSIVYDMIPALSRAQLEHGVARLISSSPDAVRCLSGLPGRPGAVAMCDVAADGATVRRTATVTGVKGLTMTFDVLPLLTKAEVETSLLDELAARVNKRPDSAVCAGNLEGRIGNSVDCTVVSGPERAELRLTVTAVDGTTIDYSYAPKR